MAKGGGGRACAPHDCLAVTVMAGSGGDPEGPLRRLGTLSVSTDSVPRSSPGKGEPTQRSQAAGQGEDCRLTADRQMGGRAQSGRGCRMGHLLHDDRRGATPIGFPLGKALPG